MILTYYDYVLYIVPVHLSHERGLYALPNLRLGRQEVAGRSSKRPAKKLAMSTIANDPGKVFETAFVMVAKIIWTAIRLFFLTLRKIFNV